MAHDVAGQLPVPGLPPAENTIACWGNRFICWRFEPDPKGGKPKKIPLDPRTLRRMNVKHIHLCVAYDEAWRIAELAGLGVGVVLDGDGRFCLDIDNCRDPATDVWDARALDAFNRFPGAAWEISPSGCGLHIFGRADPAVLAGLKPRWNGLELYSDKRFIALGSGGT